MPDDAIVVDEEKSLEVPIEKVPERGKEWKPVTALGKLVKDGTINDLGTIFNQGHTIVEPQIVDVLLPDIQEELLLIGQAKGKFGGGQRRIFKQTQKKTKEGNRIQFKTCCIVGNKDGFVGIGIGKSKETVPSREKSRRNARLHMVMVRRGCGSWECNCKQPHSIPLAVEGRSGSVRITLLPAPKGKGLCVEKECAKVLGLAGVKDVWSKMSGQTGTKLNLIEALFDALRKLSALKIKPEDTIRLGIVEGQAKTAEAGQANQ